MTPPFPGTILLLYCSVHFYGKFDPPILVYRINLGKGRRKNHQSPPPTLTPNMMQRHSDKLIRGKTPQLPIIAQVFGHTASKR